LKIKQKQVLAVSAASISSLSSNGTEQDDGKQQRNDKSSERKQHKEEKRFGYFYVGQQLNVIVKSAAADTNATYLIAVNDSSKLKRNRKMLLRQLAILNENHMDADSLVGLAGGLAGGKRKRDNDEEDVLVKKKLILATPDKEKKRRLSEVKTAEEDDRDHIEIVANVKKVKRSADENGADLGAKSEQVEAFPWEVTDFDQFYDLINKNDTDGDETVTVDAGKAAGKKDKDGQKKPPKLDDRTIFEVSENQLI
jgi:hypothetical protein